MVSVVIEIASNGAVAVPLVKRDGAFIILAHFQPQQRTVVVVSCRFRRLQQKRADALDLGLRVDGYRVKSRKRGAMTEKNHRIADDRAVHCCNNGFCGWSCDEGTK